MNQLVLDNSERYCVFRSGERLYGISALSVRSIEPRPEITTAPQSDPILTGLCHLQNEFFPVVSLQALTQIQYETPDESEQQLLILHGPMGPWGMLIDQAIGLAALETSISAICHQQDTWSKVTLGSASFQNQVLQILDPAALFRYTSNLIEMFWNSPGTTHALNHAPTPCHH
jgi:purine-binding chemotaxis protein CheW